MSLAPSPDEGRPGAPATERAARGSGGAAPADVGAAPATGSDAPLGYGLGPEWEPGPDGVPFRRATRVILLDEEDRVLLVRGHDSGEPTRSWWFTVGGGLEPGEPDRGGAAREVFEETGLVVGADALVGPVLTRSAVFDFARVTCRQDEAFFLTWVSGAHDFSEDGWTELEREVLDEMRWWSLDELDDAVAAGTVVYPTTLPGLVRTLLGGWDGSVPHLDESSVDGLTAGGTGSIGPAAAGAPMIVEDPVRAERRTVHDRPGPSAGTGGAPYVPTVGVLALQGDVREHVSALEAAGARAVPVRRRTELDAVDGLVLPGGESTTIEKLLRVFDLFDPLRERIRGGLPVYGSCAGMILLAERLEGGAPGQTTLGGIDMTVRRNAFGRQVDSFETALDAPALVADGEAPLHAVFIRAPWVEEVGRDVEVIARTPEGMVGADTADGTAHGDTAPEGGSDVVGMRGGRIVAVRHGRLLATAFHPEIGGEMRVHRHFVEMVRDAAGRGPQPST